MQMHLATHGNTSSDEKYRMGFPKAHRQFLALSQCPARVDIGSSRSEKWNGNLVRSFREVKSEMKIWFTHFENEKWNENALISRSRVKSEMKMSQNRDREWKVNWKCLEIEIEKWNFSRILEKFLEIKKVLDLQTLTLECWKMVKIVRKVECLLYELLIVALQYWAISGNIGHEIFNPCLWYQIWRIFF